MSKLLSDLETTTYNGIYPIDLSAEENANVNVEEMSQQDLFSTCKGYFKNLLDIEGVRKGFIYMFNKYCTECCRILRSIKNV